VSVNVSRVLIIPFFDYDDGAHFGVRALERRYSRRRSTDLESVTDSDRLFRVALIVMNFLKVWLSSCR
jgi:hypothetical protein